MADFLVQRIAAALDKAEKEMTWTSSRGRWEAHWSYTVGGRRALVRHQPTGDTLGEFFHIADMEHAARWQPSRVLALIESDRALLDYAIELGGVRGDASEISRGLLTLLAARWGVTP